jgi:hypothetical protein
MPAEDLFFGRRNDGMEPIAAPERSLPKPPASWSGSERATSERGERLEGRTAGGALIAESREAKGGWRSPQNVTSKLRELAEAQSRGLIDDDEFELQRFRVVSTFIGSSETAAEIPGGGANAKKEAAAGAPFQGPRQAEAALGDAAAEFLTPPSFALGHSDATSPSVGFMTPEEQRGGGTIRPPDLLGSPETIAFNHAFPATGDINVPMPNFPLRTSYAAPRAHGGNPDGQYFDPSEAYEAYLNAFKVLEAPPDLDPWYFSPWDMSQSSIEALYAPFGPLADSSNRFTEKEKEKRRCRKKQQRMKKHDLSAQANTAY